MLTSTDVEKFLIETAQAGRQDEVVAWLYLANRFLQNAILGDQAESFLPDLAASELEFMEKYREPSNEITEQLFGIKTDYEPLRKVLAAYVQKMNKRITMDKRDAVETLLVQKQAEMPADTTCLNILVVAQGGYGGYYIKDNLKKSLPNACISLHKKEWLTITNAEQYDIIIIAGYFEITASRNNMIYKKPNITLSNIAVFRNGALCNHSRLLEFINHPWS